MTETALKFHFSPITEVAKTSYFFSLSKPLKKKIISFGMIDLNQFTVKRGNKELFGRPKMGP